MTKSNQKYFIVTDEIGNAFGVGKNKTDAQKNARKNRREWGLTDLALQPSIACTKEVYDSFKKDFDVDIELYNGVYHTSREKKEAEETDLYNAGYCRNINFDEFKELGINKKLIVLFGMIEGKLDEDSAGI